MPSTERLVTTTAVHEPDATLFAALELSLSRWVVVASAPGESKVSKHTLPACDGPALLALLDGLRGVVQIRVTPKTRNPFTIKALSISGVTWEWHFLNHAGQGLGPAAACSPLPGRGAALQTVAGAERRLVQGAPPPIAGACPPPPSHLASAS